MRFSEAIKLFNKYRSLEKEAGTIKGYDLDLRQFCLWLHDPLITQVTPEHVVEYVNGMKELGWSQNAIMVKCVCFTQFFKFWAKKGYPVLNYELIPHVKREYREPKVANIEHTEKLLELCDKYPDDPYFVRNKALILMYADTGARNSEITSMNRDVDTEVCEEFQDFKQYSYIIKTKKSRGRKPFRRIFWYDRTNEALKKWIKIRDAIAYDIDKDALFIGITSKGVQNAGRRLKSHTIALMLRKLCRMANVPLVNCHSQRHRFGTDLASRGASNSVVSDLMGHADLSSSFIYTHLNDEQLKKAHLKYKKKIV